MAREVTGVTRALALLATATASSPSFADDEGEPWTEDVPAQAADVPGSAPPTAPAPAPPPPAGPPPVSPYPTPYPGQPPHPHAGWYYPPGYYPPYGAPPLATPPALAPVPMRPGPPGRDVGSRDGGEPGASSWYGWQILIIDVATVATFAADDSGTRMGGGLAYTLGGPVVHWAHGQQGAGWGSLALRSFTPLLFIGADDDAGRSAAYGAALLASVLDITLLAHERMPKSRRRSAALAPYVAVGRGSASSGLGGSFP